MDEENEHQTEAEKKVEVFIKEKNITCKYEQAVFIQDEVNRPRVWTPDFYLPQLGVYIEVCGARRRAYKYRKEIYFKNDIDVIFIKTYYSEEAWQKFLIERLEEIHSKRKLLINNLKTNNTLNAPKNLTNR